MIVTQNYTGCIENLFLNTTNFIREMKEAYELEEAFKYQKINTIYACPSSPIYAVTFLTRLSHARLKGYEAQKQMNVSFYFRTYEDKGLMMYHEFASKGFVKVFLEEGKVKVELKLGDKPRIILDNYDEKFNDGRWHSLVLTLSRNKLVLDIDQRPMTTTKNIQFSTSREYYIAGGIDKDGFVGCMRLILVDGNYKLPQDWTDGVEVFSKGEVIVDACQMIDRCNPNPCKHGGTCNQNSMEFFCDCRNTGYSGAVCHTCNLNLFFLTYPNLFCL